MINYLKYSGASLTIYLNPLYWKAFPYIRNISKDDVYLGPDSHTWEFGFLFLIIRVWVDNGNW